jgi:hypothetical protein
VSTGSIMVDPQAETTLDSGANDVTLDEFKGLVTASNQAGAEFTVQAFLDDAQAVALGPVDVFIDNDTLFIDETGMELDATEFFDALMDNLTFVEIYGALSDDGRVRGDRIEIEDQTGGTSSLVRVEGQIVGVALNTFMLRVIEIEDGEDIAGPIIAGLGGGDIEVAYDLDTLFIVGRDSLSDSSEVVLGRRVKVEFCSFTTPPFLACIVDVDDDLPRFDGTMTDLTGLPDTFVMQMDPGELAITSGLVQDENTDVTIDLTGTSIVLDTEGVPGLLTDDMAVGQEIEVEGDITGLPAMPTLNATRVWIQPGYLDDAFVTVADQPNLRFLTTGGEIVDDFGPNVTPGAQQVFVQDGVTFSGDVSNTTEFFALFGTPQGQTARVDVLGLGSDVANEIRAYHIDVRTTAAPK